MEPKTIKFKQLVRYDGEKDFEENLFSGYEYQNQPLNKRHFFLKNDTHTFDLLITFHQDGLLIEQFNDEIKLKIDLDLNKSGKCLYHFQDQVIIDAKTVLTEMKNEKSFIRIAYNLIHQESDSAHQYVIEIRRD